MRNLFRTDQGASTWMRPTSIMIVVLALCLLIVNTLTAQEGDDPTTFRPILTDVWVTVQDFSNMRSGPGELWESLVVLDPGVTLRATGRTGDGRWIQVAYEGELKPEATDDATIDGITYGWIRDWLLMWTGDILTLPVDGVQTTVTARRIGPTITIDADTRIYQDGIDPVARIPALVDEPTEVELTGRIGSPSVGYHWLQFRYNGQYYWTATWEVGYIRNYFLLPDGSYIYSYGRLLIQLRKEINDNSNVLNSIARRWQGLDRGEQVSCNGIPAYAGIPDTSFKPIDLQREPIYEPSAQALQTAIDQTNNAIMAFEDVCMRTGEDRFVRPEEVQAALDEIDAAQRNFTLARTLLTPFAVRDPLLGNIRQ